MARTLRTKDMTCTTESSSRTVATCVRLGQVEELWVFFRIELEKWSFGDDAWVGTGSQVKEKIHKKDAKQVQQRKSGVDCPVFTYHEHTERYSDAKRATVDVEHTRQFFNRSSDTAPTQEAIVRGEYLVYFGHYLSNYYAEGPSDNRKVKLYNNWMQGKRQKKERAYFEITQDPPHLLPPLRTTRRNFNTYKLPTHRGFFFIDFAQQCQLKLLQKRTGEFGDPLPIEQYGKNVIINMEDSSLQEGQLVKYEEQQITQREKRAAIEGKLKERLDRDRGKLRSKSLLAMRQQLIDLYTQPIQFTHRPPIENFVPTEQVSSPKKVEAALKKLGLIRQ